MAMLLSPDFDEALVFASRLHAGQLRKGSPTPYVAHLLAVTAIVLEHGGTEAEAIAALLHDAVEDQGGAATRAKIRRRFGEAVAAIVDVCTDAETEPKPPWRERKEAYVAHLVHASPSVRLVAAADKLHNARSILADYQRLGEHGEEIWSRFRVGRADTLWFYRAVVDALRTAEPTPVVEELTRAVDALERLGTAPATRSPPALGSTPSVGSATAGPWSGADAADPNR